MVSVKSVQKVENTEIAKPAVNTDELYDLAVTAAKIATGAVGSDQLADGGVDSVDLADSIVSASKIVDGAINSAKIADAGIDSVDMADSIVNYAKINDNFCQIGYDAIDSVETWINFPTGFPDVPKVVAVGDDVTDVQVTQRAADSFAWQAASAGSAIWIAIYK